MDTNEMEERDTGLLASTASAMVLDDTATTSIPTLVDWLRRDDCPEELQLEAACCLTSIMIHEEGTNINTPISAFNNAKSRRDDDGESNLTLMVTGAIPQLVRLLGTSPSFPVREQVVCALGNMARYSVQFRDAILEAGVLPPLLEQLDPLLSEDDDWATTLVDVVVGRDDAESQNKRTTNTTTTSTPCSVSRKRSMQCYGTWALAGLCFSSKPSSPPPDFNILRTALPTLAKLLQYSNDALVLKQACTTVACLSTDSGSGGSGCMERKQAVLAAGICPRLVALLDDRDMDLSSLSSSSSWYVVQEAAVRTLAIIMAGNPNHYPHQTQMIIQHVLDCNEGGSVLSRFRTLLDSPVTEIRRYTCWAICNITTSGHKNEHHIQAVIDGDCIHPLIHLAVHGSDDVDCRKQAFLTVFNTLARGTAQQVQYIVQQGCVAPIVNLLMMVSDDPTMIRVALVALEKILRVGQELVNASPPSMAESTSRIQGVGSNSCEHPAHSHTNNAKNPMARLICQTNGLEVIRTLRQRFAQDYLIGTQCTRILQVYFDEVVDEITGIAPAA